jgi:GGDEF domain-containing protein
MGGDEFLVLLPECPPDKVKLVLTRLGPIDIDFGEGTISVTNSKGSAQYQAGETVEQLIARADAALYTSKADRREAQLSRDILFQTT